MLFGYTASPLRMIHRCNGGVSGKTGHNKVCEQKRRRSVVGKSACLNSTLFKQLFYSCLCFVIWLYKGDPAHAEFGRKKEILRLFLFGKTGNISSPSSDGEFPRDSSCLLTNHTCASLLLAVGIEHLPFGSRTNGRPTTS